MANSRKSSSTDLAARVAMRLSALLSRDSRIQVGLSGGLDSVVLLHLLHRLAPDFHWQISALHVHHGISPNADAWAAFCAGYCASLGVPLQTVHVDISPLRERHGLEAAARMLRHEAYARSDSDVVALAHHADDQAETLLLQLLRGSGVRGAAAMPYVAETSGRARLVRPLLAFGREVVAEYARAHQLSWVEDESNADPRYARNFLRHCIFPRLMEHFPAARHTLARSAANFAEAAGLMDELAVQDARGAISDGWLELTALAQISLPRAKNLLRHYLETRGAAVPSAAQLEEMLGQLASKRADAAICVDFAGWQLRRYRNRAWVEPAPEVFDPATSLSWQGESALFWPPLGCSVGFNPAQGAGLSLAKLRQAPVTLRLRQGADHLRPQPGARSRSLKNLLQESAIPPWQRARFPLLYCGDLLVWIPGVAMAAEFRADPGETGILPALSAV
ncbi:MAG: tRNA lysidine(34) synthetase TilS [Gallionella sp.]|nr:tRNA lysidine(34) synthetase TilS [Gallionella sp.]